MQTFTIHTDSGHGWLAVRLRDIIDVGLSAQSFSRYSYRKAKINSILKRIATPTNLFLRSLRNTVMNRRLLKTTLTVIRLFAGCPVSHRTLELTFVCILR
jgi:hypothetical protein